MKKSKADKKKIPVKVGDAYKTIIYINEGDNPEKEIKKYLKNLIDYPKNSVVNFTKGNSKLFKKKLDSKNNF